MAAAPAGGRRRQICRPEPVSGGPTMEHSLETTSMKMLGSLEMTLDMLVRKVLICGEGRQARATRRGIADQEVRQKV